MLPQPTSLRMIPYTAAILVSSEKRREFGKKTERKKGEILFEPGQSLRAEKNLTLYISRVASSAVEIMSR